MNIENIMETLFELRSENLPHDALAEVFDRLIWCLVDNGGEIGEVRERWIESESLEKCAIALHMNEMFPYETMEEMVDKFTEVTEKWPELEARCEEITYQRAKQNV